MAHYITFQGKTARFSDLSRFTAQYNKLVLAGHSVNEELIGDDYVATFTEKVEPTSPTIKELAEMLNLELIGRDKFRSKLAEIIKAGIKFSVEQTSNPFKFWTSSTGKRFTIRVRGEKGGLLIGRVRYSMVNTSVKEVNNLPKHYRLLTDQAPTLGHYSINGIEQVSYRYDVQEANVETPTWATLLKAIADVINVDAVETCLCGKCGGSGILPQFMYYADGRCFECQGIGKWLKVKK